MHCSFGQAIVCGHLTVNGHGPSITKYHTEKSNLLLELSQLGHAPVALAGGKNPA